MKPITVTISNIDDLNQIRQNLSAGKPLSAKQQQYLIQFLSELSISELLLDGPPVSDDIEVSIWDADKLKASLEQWENLLWNIPGFNFAPNCYILDNDSSELLAKGFVLIALFAPSLAYNRLNENEAYHLLFKADGTARFEFPTLDDARQYPELYNFKGTWEEAYLLLIETLKKGWPMEEFPEELKPFLKK